jgi:hypothetical protein
MISDAQLVEKHVSQVRPRRTTEQNGMLKLENVIGAYIRSENLMKDDIIATRAHYLILGAIWAND